MSAGRGIFRRGPIALLLVSGLVSFATAAAAEGSSAFSREQREAARGHDLALARCAACHAVDALGTSPNRRAPPFRTLSGRYVELTLHRKLTEIAETGHYDMPPVPVHSNEVRDIAAYLNSLEPAPR